MTPKKEVLDPASGTFFIKTLQGRFVLMEFVADGSPKPIDPRRFSDELPMGHAFQKGAFVPIYMSGGCVNHIVRKK